MERDNTKWLADLQNRGPIQASALEDLHAIILAGLPYALQGWLAADHPEFDALAEEVAQETLLRVLDRLSTFEGRSQFTTWVHIIGVRIALTELRRRRWKDISLDEMTGDGSETAAPGLLEDVSTGPEKMVERKELLTMLNRLMLNELTEKQRQALMAIAVQGMPLEEVARRMGTQRNALYKLLHDARLRLKRRLDENGLTAQEVMAAFEHG